MATRANPLYQIRLRRQLSKSNEPLSLIARMTGVAHPVLFRFVKGQRGLNDDTAAKVLDYLEKTTEESQIESIIQDAIEYQRQLLKWYEQQLKDCPAEEQSHLLECRDKFLIPQLESLQNLVDDLIPKLKEESEQARQRSARIVKKPKKSKDGN